MTKKRVVTKGKQVPERKKRVQISGGCGRPWLLMTNKMQCGNNYRRWISRDAVKDFLKSSAKEITARSSTFPDGLTWKVRRSHGCIRIGCQSFSRNAIAKIRKWAFA